MPSMSHNAQALAADNFSFRSWFLRMAKPITVVAGGCLLLAVSGCYKPNEQAGKSGSAAKPAHSHGEHDHPTTGPHKGSLIELGNEEFHAELLHDDAAHKVTIYLLDGHAKEKATSAEAKLPLNFVVDGKPQQFWLAAVPQEGDAPGTSSRFELADPAIDAAIDAPKNQGRLNVTIGGKSYSGSLAGEGHEHDHGHKH
jgi:hypothetical protein